VERHAPEEKMTIDFKGYINLLILAALTCAVFILLNENGNLKEEMRRGRVIETIPVQCNCQWQIDTPHAAVYEMPGKDPKTLWEDELKKATDERMRKEDLLWDDAVDSFSVDEIKSNADISRKGAKSAKGN